VTDDSEGKRHDHAGSGSPRKRSRARATFTNMKVKMPLHRKLCLVFRNNWIKIRRGQNCCGHPGEPGC
jgi:hypothetical protein